MSAEVTVSRAEVEMWRAMLRETQKSMQGIPIGDCNLPSDYIIKKQMTEEVLGRGRKVGYDLNGVTVECAGHPISWENFCKTYEFFGGIEVESRVDEERYNLADILLNYGYIYSMEQFKDYDGLEDLFREGMFKAIKYFESNKDVDYNTLMEHRAFYSGWYYNYLDMKNFFKEISTYLYENNITPLGVHGLKAKYISIDFENPRDEDKPIIEKCLEAEREKNAKYFAEKE